MFAVRHKRGPRDSANQRAEAGHVLRAGAVEGLLPAVKEAPDRPVPEEVPARAGSQGPIGLPADLQRRGVVLALVGGFDHQVGAKWCAREVGMSFL